jgi:predicted lipoprotein with Yx(FWY)xxD motif
MKIRALVAIPALVFALTASGASLAMASNSHGTSHATKVMVKASSNKTLGEFLVTGKGYTLYHMPVENNGKFFCTGSCLKLWKPFTLPKGTKSATAGKSVVDTLGVITRPNGAKQVTYDGWPLYTFVGDSKPGQTNGQEYDKEWTVVATQPEVSLVVGISNAAGNVAYGTVTMSYVYEKKTFTSSCSAPSCTLWAHADRQVTLTEAPTNATVAPFTSWQYQPVHSPGSSARTSSTNSTIKLTSRDDFRVSANYTPVA